MYCLVKMKIMGRYMEIKEENIVYVYIGRCNKIITKFVTQNIWDFRIWVKYDRNDMPYYLDRYGMEIGIFEEDDEEFYLF